MNPQQQPYYGVQAYAKENPYQFFGQPFPYPGMKPYQPKQIDQAKVDADAAALRKAMKGLGTDEKAIIQIAANRTNRERLAMIESFKRQFNRDLRKDLKSELSGKFEDAILALFMDPVDYDCWSLKKAMKGLGTNEDTLIEILATRSNERINQIKARYLEIYKKDLVKVVQSDTSGFFRQVLLKLLEANRSNNPYPDQKDCNDCAKNLFFAATQKKEILNDTFLYVFTQKSREELALIAQVYYEWYRKTLFEVVKTSFSGDAKRILKAIVYALLSPSEYFAYRVNKAVKGLGTKDTMLIRILVSRDEIDMERIKRYYKQLYKVEMFDDVKNDVSGDYKTILLALIGR